MLLLSLLIVLAVAPRPSLRELMEKYRTDKGWHHAYYLQCEPLFEPHRDEPIRILEIGVEGGRSMALWDEYFAHAELIAGVGYGNTFRTQSCTLKRTECFRGDQSNITFLNELIAKTGGHFDIIIDDGSHLPAHQFATMRRLLRSDALKDDSLYIVEDIETSYWRDGSLVYDYPIRGAGLGGRCSFVEHAKRLIDVVNREFVGGSYRTLRDAADHRIRTIEFGANLIILRTGSAIDLRRMGRNYRLSGQRSTLRGGSPAPSEWVCEGE